ncbi:uncharacterized protein LOC135482395 [Liolophura sinensis]|uniref:uncharacterized protein LOC135482395 n=1 Tax=Liolophura sinensis TaxID=3198878 RepID=UPI003157FD9A
MGPLFTGPTTVVPARYISCNSVACLVPNHTIPILEGRVLAGWYVSVSDDADTFGNELIYLPYDNRCVTCTGVNALPMCSWTDSSCYIGGMCYNPGDSNGGSCEVCDIGQSLTRWSMPGEKCFVGGTCYIDGYINPADNCTVCNSTTSTSEFTPRGNVCNEGGRCYEDAEISHEDSCRICDVTHTTTSLTTTEGSCFIGGECYTDGQADPGNSCQQCDSNTNTFTLSGHGGCTIPPSTTCWPDETINPADTCQLCDVIKSTNTWSDIQIPLTNGRTTPCGSLCDYVRDHQSSIFSLVCNYPNFISSQNFRDMCFVKNFNALPQGICPGHQGKLQRWMAMCLYTTVVDAANDPQVCP